jgi:tetratricopeptide (TPR) repeat protein
MKLTFSAPTLLTLTTIVALAQAASMTSIGGINLSISPVSASNTLVSQKSNSNMVFPSVGKGKKQGSNVELAKEAMFRDGDYVKAKQYLDIALQSEPKEPLAYAMSTLYPFSSGNYEKVKEYGEKTSKTAEQLMKTNPLRGNLYQGVGLGILGAYELKKSNGGALGALSKLQKVFEYMDKAKKIDANNSELNLIKGYMDLLLAVNLPFSDTSDAIEQLKNAEPKYLAWRGMYIGYRDLKEYDKASNAINKPNCWEFAVAKSKMRNY